MASTVSMNVRNLYVDCSYIPTYSLVRTRPFLPSGAYRLEIISAIFEASDSGFLL